MAMYRSPLIPNNFKVPQELIKKEFIFLPITIELNDLDYDAVMDNKDSKGNLIYPNHTKQQNLIDLGYHQKDMQKRASFTYSILTPDKSICIGCIYIYPSDKDNYDVDYEFWVRSSFRYLEIKIGNTLDKWIKAWPFQNPRKVN